MWPRDLKRWPRGLKPVAKLEGKWDGGNDTDTAGHSNREAHRFLIGLLVEGLTKNSHNKEVDDEGHRESDGGFNQEVHVGFANVHPAGSVYLSRLGESEVEGRVKVSERLPMASTTTFILCSL